MTTLTIIIVSKDNNKGVKKTLQSIDCNNKHIEIIIKKWGKTFSEIKSKNYMKLISPDTGIYDAMNQAIKVSSGKWIIFMNAGDEFKISLVFILKILNKTTADILYSDVIVDNYYIRKTYPLKKIKYGSIFCHQSAIINSALFQGHYYNLKFKLASDYEFFLKNYLDKKIFLKLDFIIANIESKGVSDTKRDIVFKEWYCIQKYYNINYFYRKLLLWRRLIVHNVIKLLKIYHD